MFPNKLIPFSTSGQLLTCCCLVVVALIGSTNANVPLYHRTGSVQVAPSSVSNSVDPNYYTGGSCRARGLCCSGRDRSCVAPIIRPDGSVSPLGNLIAAADNSLKECYCDSACITLGDCCPDYKENCGVIDCRVSEWEPWTECDASCGIGQMSRSRTILQRSQNGGQECPDLHQKRACHGQKCEVQDNDKMLRESAIILQSSYSSTRNIDEDKDIRRNLRLNYPKDPLKENVNEYCVLFQVTKSKKACETSLDSATSAKLTEGSKVCVQCQEAAMRRHLGYRCYGHGSVRKTTRWTALANNSCHGRWTRMDDSAAEAAGCLCGKNSTLIPDFIFV